MLALPSRAKVLGRGTPQGGDSDWPTMWRGPADVSLEPDTREGRGGRRGAPDVRAVMALLYLGSVAVVVTSLLPGMAVIRPVGAVTLGTVGFGSAIMASSSVDSPCAFVVASAASGFAVDSLVGTVLLEAGEWRLAGIIGAIMVVGAAVVHMAEWLKHGAGLMGLLAKLDLRRCVSRVASGPIACFAVGTAISVAAEVASRPVDPHSGGLLASISPVWFAGISLLGSSLVWAWLVRDRHFGALVVGMVVILASTAPIVYSLPRFDWTQKHIGVTELFLVHGSVMPGLDIYQSWPGFFAAIAWLWKAAGIEGVEGLARWWPLGVDIMWTLGVRTVGESLGFTRRQAWLGALLFFLGNLIAQDYYSPQSEAYFAALVLCSLLLSANGRKSVLTASEWIACVVMSIALADSHQLTPFVLGGLLVVFALGGFARSRFAPALVLVPAIAWAGLHWTKVVQYGALSSVGDVAKNVQTPNAGWHYHYGLTPRLFDVAQAAAPVLIGVLALLALWRQRDRMSVVLVSVACSMAGLFLFRYGTEDLLRVVLFTIPWLSLLAAYGVEDCKDVKLSWRGLSTVGSWRRGAIGGCIAVLFPLYVTATFVLDDINVVRPGDLAAVRRFEVTAPSGSLLISVGNPSYAPLRSTARYGDVYEGAYAFSARDQRWAVRGLDQLVRSISKGGGAEAPPAVYAVTTQQAASQWSEDGVVTMRGYLDFEAQLVTDRQWRVIDRTNTAILFRFVGKGEARRVKK